MNNNSINPYSVLIIEDEDDLRKQIVELLKFDFETIYEAPSAEIAFEIYKDKKPDIIFSDINLPNMNGLEFLEQIRINDHSTKAIVLTAHSDVEYLMNAVGLKLTGYLIKPISRKAISDVITKVLKEMKNFKTNSVNIINLKENYSWNMNTQELYNGIELIELAPLEKRLVNLFTNNQNIMMDFDTLIIKLWDNYEQDKMNALKILIKKLRKKLPEDTIVSVFKEGFIFK